MESCVFECCLTCLQGIEELGGVIVCDRDLLDDTIDIVYSAHLAVHYAYGFYLFCQILDEGMTSSVCVSSILDQVHGPFWYNVYMIL